MLKINLQLFAHKKGVGSTKNGRDSESKRLGVKRADGQFVLAGNISRVSAEPISIPARTSVSVPTIRCMPRRTEPCALSGSARTASASAFTLSSSKRRRIECQADAPAAHAAGAFFVGVRHNHAANRKT